MPILRSCRSGGIPPQFLAVTSSGGVRTRVARIHTGLTREDADEMARLLNSSPDLCGTGGLVTPSLTASLVLSRRAQGWRRWCSPPKALVRTRPQFYLEGVQYLAKMPDVRTNLGALLEVFLTMKRPAPDRTGQRQSDRHVGRGYRARHVRTSASSASVTLRAAGCTARWR